MNRAFSIIVVCMFFSVLFFGLTFSCQADAFPADFILGVDVSELAAQENSGAVYYDAAGDPGDALAILASFGVNSIRLRVWNDPFDTDGNGYGGGNIDSETAAALSARAAALGMNTLLDFHYSDFWADPSRQIAPKAWAGMSLTEKADALYAYTRETLALVQEAGGEITMVQVGNEINNGMAGEYDPADKAQLVAAGCRAVRDFAAESGSDIRIAVHLTDPEDPDPILETLTSFIEAGADFDAVGLSYYPYWHGSLANLAALITTIREDLGKDVFIAETAWPFSLEEGDRWGNVIGTAPDPYEVSGNGQAQAILDICQTAASAHALGIYYWGGIWTPVGTNLSENLNLWEEFGSGWASRFAHGYDPEHVTDETGGCAWDNQAMFDFSGHPLAVLDLYHQIASGEVTVDPDFPASQEETQTDHEGDRGDNLVRNPDFEGEDRSMWVTTSMKRDIPYDYQKKANDAHSGVMAFHYWSPNDMDFYIEQTITGLEPGLYQASVWSQGGDMKDASMDFYVILGVGNIKSVSFMNTHWADWQHPVLQVEIPGSTVTIGVHIVCGAKSWGTLDDFELIRVK